MYILTLFRFAGSDTTAAAMSSILYHLMKTPRAYRKLVDEIDRATFSGQLGPGCIKYKQAARLPYLDACCKEGMRLHPSVGWTMPRHVPAGGREILGERFEAGTRVGMNAAVVQRDPSIFGADADEFNPDRWLGEDAVKMKRCMLHVSVFSTAKPSHGSDNPCSSVVDREPVSARM